MAVEYKSGQSRLLRELQEKIAATYTAHSSGAPLANKLQTRLSKIGISKKISDTAPTTTDYPQKLGDFCIHYNAAGAYQAVYVATSATLNHTTGALTNVTWTALTVA